MTPTSPRTSQAYSGGVRPRKDSDMEGLSEIAVCNNNNEPILSKNSDNHVVGTDDDDKTRQERKGIVPASENHQVVMTEEDGDGENDEASTGMEEERVSQEGEDELGEESSSTNRALSTSTEDPTNPPNRLQRSDSYLLKLPVAKATPIVTVEEAAASSGLKRADDLVILSTVSASRSALPRRAAMISIKVFKPIKDVKLGIRVQYNSHGHLAVNHLKDGLLVDSPLHTGDELIRIDGLAVTCWTPTRVMQYLRDRTGFVSLVAHNPNGDPKRAESAVFKSNCQDKMGVTFSRSKGNKNDENACGNLCISQLNLAGLMGSRSILKEGDLVESINGIPALQMDPKTAVSIIKDMDGMVTLTVLQTKNGTKQHSNQQEQINLAELQHSNGEKNHNLEAIVASYDDDNDDTLVATATEIEEENHDVHEHHDFVEPAFVSVMVQKESPKSRLGIEVTKAEGKIYVHRLLPSGLLSTSPLQGGMVLLSINHAPCQGMSVKEALAVLRSAQGSLHLLAYHKYGNPDYVQAMVAKSADHSSVGISFKSSSGRPLKICSIRGDGLFSTSVLNVANHVIRINEIDCGTKRPKEAVAIVRSASESVTILAKTNRSACVVVNRILPQHY